MVFIFISEVSLRPLQVGFCGGYEARLPNKYVSVEGVLAILITGWVSGVVLQFSTKKLAEWKEGRRGGGGCHSLLVCSLSHHFGGSSSPALGWDNKQESRPNTQNYKTSKNNFCTPRHFHSEIDFHSIWFDLKMYLMHWSGYVKLLLFLQGERQLSCLILFVWVKLPPWKIMSGALCEG